MNFGSSNKPFGQKCIDVVSTTDNKGKKTNYGMIIMYSNSGEVPFAQIYHNGILVTYAYGKYIANDSSSARFIGYDTAFSQPFKDIGMQDSEIPEEIKTSKTPTSSSWNK
jgi:regulatory protein YycI of two-component signal transduction system YycFG